MSRAFAIPYRPLIVVAGIFGALGVAAAARASHGGDDNLGTAANFLLLHAPVLIGLSVLAASRLAVIAGAVLALGVALFAGDLAMRSFTGNALFPMAAPIGSGAMILGWILVVATGIWGRRG